MIEFFLKPLWPYFVIFTTSIPTTWTQARKLDQISYFMYLETGKVRAGTPRLRPPAHPGVALEVLDFKTYQRKYQFWRHFQIRLRLLRGKLPRVAIMTRQTWTTAHIVRGCLAKVAISFNIYQWFCKQQNAYINMQKTTFPKLSQKSMVLPILTRVTEHTFRHTYRETMM